VLFREPGSIAQMDGVEILDELRSDLGMLLWQINRDVLLWAGTEPEERPRLFTAGALSRRERQVKHAGLAGEALAAVELLTGLLRSDVVEDASHVTYCCERLSDWAVSARVPQTAVWFAQAAAAASPADASVAMRVGQLTAGFGRLTLAEDWLRRAIALGRRSGDWASYGDAWVELGRVMLLRDQVARARTCFLKATRAARRHSLWATRGQAYYGLFKAAVAADDHDDAERYAQTALSALGKQHPDIPALLHDLAELMLRRGDNSLAAMHILQNLLPTRRPHGERIETLTLLVKAAGGAGEQTVLQQAWLDVLDALQRLGETPEAARYLLKLARAAADVTEVRMAQESARRALAIATRRVEQPLAVEAAALLEEFGVPGIAVPTPRRLRSRVMK
jgi:tetratricopeptide (TPR) repeat protein